ncbi:MAG: hypothetical protein J6S23_06075 [Clostridia bacterium]|nr:hypothetical protein [Clostridia bacterium]
MKKINFKKKDAIYLAIISLFIIATIVLSVMLVMANQRKASFEMSNYYNNKVMSFAIQNTNLSKEQIVFIGDSITDLYPLDDYYADLDLACYNRGIGGDTTQGVIDRLQVSIFDLKPSKIVLMIGTNDVNGGIPNDKIISNYKKILEEIKINQPLVELYFMSVIPQNKILKQSSGIDVTKNNKTINKINTEIEKLCEEYGHTYIDLYPALLDENGYLRADCSDDGLHLNSTGFEIWTSLLKPCLER